MCNAAVINSKKGEIGPATKFENKKKNFYSKPYIINIIIFNYKFIDDPYFE